MKKLRSLHAAELLQADERAAQRYGRQAEALREQLEQEKEALAQQERTRTQQRWVSPSQHPTGHGPRSEQSWGVPGAQRELGTPRVKRIQSQAATPHTCQEGATSWF